MDSRSPSSSPPLGLRTPDAADYAALGAWVPDAETCIRWSGPKLKFPFMPEQLPQLLAEPGSHSFVMSRGPAEALGFCQFWEREAGVAHLARIILAPAARGQGLAATLCRLLMAQAAQIAGAHTFTLRVYRDNHPALAAYEGLGFVAVPEQSDERIFFMRKPPAGAAPAKA
ncbi:Protein N-acetyltransferase, RimJ/RimL family [Polaromonas sp. YR568]|uniref:GNAT family N-acetyltransferase n=1 Tax=Polaromonas sp. YR568 TaxID=1855301 RepID=UPI0008F144AC|nr:GNAT family protein [Polaromonas sp. YR568]SFU48077.1 Protein N-acetyltransferase, RimJ/RimL family [Polaromonas sp. YR568]